jgi:hypothetical protein
MSYIAVGIGISVPRLLIHRTVSYTNFAGRVPERRMYRSEPQTHLAYYTIRYYIYNSFSQ